MSHINPAVARIERRDLRRLFTAAAVVAAMGAVVVFQLHQEAARGGAGVPEVVMERPTER